MGIDPDDLQRSLRSVDSLSRSLTIGVIVAGQLAALAVVLAVVVSDSLSEAPSSSRCWRSSDFSRSG